MQNIEIMPRYSTIYCGKTNIPFGYLAFFRLVIWQSFSSTTKAAAARAAPVAATMTGTTRTGKRNHPTNPPFLLETPLYKGNERRWVGGVQPNINPTSTQHAKLSWRVASSSLMVGQWWVEGGLNASNPPCSKPLAQRISLMLG